MVKIVKYDNSIGVRLICIHSIDFDSSHCGGTQLV